MINIEKTLKDYLNDKGPALKESTILATTSNSNERINTIFKLINGYLDEYSEEKSLSKIQTLLGYINSIIENKEGVNRKIVKRKLQKLDEKISRVITNIYPKEPDEIDSEFEEAHEINPEFEEVYEKIDSLESKQLKTNSKRYEFIDFMIEEVHNFTYLEYSFNKLKGIINAKDSNNNSLLKNVIEKYLVNCDNPEKIAYYGSIISLILSREDLVLTEKEKNDIIKLIRKTIYKNSNSKKAIKKNKAIFIWLEIIISSLKNLKDKKSIDEIACKFNIPLEFNEVLIKEAKLARINPLEEECYFVDDYIVTIDDNGTVEIDDGVSCIKLPNGNFLYGIHIASPLGYFDYNSEIIETALSRTKSIYLPEKYRSIDGDDYYKIIPIFPYAFSAKTGSLTPNNPKYARSYYFEIDKEGNVINEKFLRSVVKSSRKLSYFEANHILEHGSEDSNLQELFTNLQEVTGALGNKYKPKPFYEKMKENADDITNLKVKRTGSEKIIYHAALLTGNRVAEFFANSKEGYPCLYRVHVANEEDTSKIVAMIDNLVKTYGKAQCSKLCTLLEETYLNKYYDLKGKHQGLNLEHYCHCTSGLRRAADIVVEHALEVCYDKNPSDSELASLEAEIAKRAAAINDQITKINWFVKEYARSYKKIK